MLDLKFIRENREAVKESLKSRNNISINIDELLSFDEERRKILLESESLKAERNKANDRIAGLMKERKNPKEVIDSMKVVSQKIANLDSKVEELDKKIEKTIHIIPNIPDKSVPIGSPEANKVVKTWGNKKEFNFTPKSHVQLAEKLDIICFGIGSKISGSNFILYKGAGARLERALINFMLDLHTKKHGYTEIFPPFLVNRRSMFGTGQIPKLEDDMYRLRDEDLFLIPTAEVPVTNIHSSEVLEEEELPVCYTAYSACFRREAGSYGKDTKGLVRVHQFNKVELVKFVKPETSWDEHEKLLRDAEEVLEILGLPYRVLVLATGDISFAAAKCYDIELFAPGTNAWLEVSSCSNFTDFQARRANIRYRQKDNKKVSFVHTLNASGVALPRLVVALLENYQNEDGSVAIPEALRPFMDGMDRIGA